MGVKALNFKMEEEEVLAMKEVASVFNMTLTDAYREAAKEYVEKMKKDPFYRLTANVRNASAEETDEILSEIENMTDDDLAIASVKKKTVRTGGRHGQK